MTFKETDLIIILSIILPKHLYNHNHIESYNILLRAEKETDLIIL